MLHWWWFGLLWCFLLIQTYYSLAPEEHLPFFCFLILLPIDVVVALLNDLGDLAPVEALHCRQEKDLPRGPRNMRQAALDGRFPVGLRIIGCVVDGHGSPKPAERLIKCQFRIAGGLEDRAVGDQAFEHGGNIGVAAGLGPG